jgi:hypothetical protein
MGKIAGLRVAFHTGDGVLWGGRDGRRYQTGADNVWRLERVGVAVKYGMMKIRAAGAKRYPIMVQGNGFRAPNGNGRTGANIATRWHWNWNSKFFRG